MGWALRSRDHVSNPTLGVHPHDPSRESCPAFRTVNLKAAPLGLYRDGPRMSRLNPTEPLTRAAHRSAIRLPQSPRDEPFRTKGVTARPWPRLPETAGESR